MQAHAHRYTAGNGRKPLRSATAARIWPIEVAVHLTPRQVEWNAHSDVSRSTHVTNVKSWVMWSALLQTVDHVETKAFTMKLILWIYKCGRRHESSTRRWHCLPHQNKKYYSWRTSNWFLYNTAQCDLANENNPTCTWILICSSCDGPNMTQHILLLNTVQMRY